MLRHAKSRITNVEATVVLMMNIAASDKRAVIPARPAGGVCRGPFLLLFWASKKVKIV